MSQIKPSPRGSRRAGDAPTLSDVAKAAGVSPMTASRVINKDPAVRAATRELVDAAIAKLNYTPNTAARSLAGARRARITLLYGNPSSAYLSELLVGCLTEASRSDVQLLLEKCDLDCDADVFVRQLIDAGIDGVILPPPFADSQRILQALTAADIPASVFASSKLGPNMIALSIDDRQAAFDMTRTLLARGHRRIGFIAGNTNQAASAKRLDGYRQALTEAKLEIDEGLIAPGDFSYRSGLTAARVLLDLPQPPTAIFASNDDMAAAAIAIAHSRHIDVPVHLSICGFDDTALATTVSPELTTVRQPVAEMAQAAVAMLATALAKRRRTGESVAGKIHVFAHEIIQRESDGPPPSAPKASRSRR